MDRTEEFENKGADLLVHAAATMRHANNKCAEIQGRHLSMFECRKDKEWRYWDSQRGGAANRICLVIMQRRKAGLDCDPDRVGKYYQARYREMIRADREFDEFAKTHDAAAQMEWIHANGWRIPTAYIPDGWLDGLDLPEALALAPAVWKSYLEEHAEKQS